MDQLNITKVSNNKVFKIQIKEQPDDIMKVINDRERDIDIFTSDLLNFDNPFGIS
jgi:hypothetical protein